MPHITEHDVLVPADVPRDMRDEYLKNYLTLTKNTGRMMLFAGDQKIEHMNTDFFGTVKVDGEERPIPEDDSTPEHFFRIARGANISVFASQLGLIARYGHSYPDVPYLVKINSKTPIVKTTQRDPLSRSLVDVADVAQFKKDSSLNVIAVGYTVYIGSEYESEMLAEASRVAHEAHRNGLIAVFWMYPRGKAVKDEGDPHLIAGAAGVGACLGADFVKVNYPAVDSPSEAFKEAILAAGRTQVVTAGGSSQSARGFLQQTWDQIHISGCAGSATGRNIHQKPLDEAVRLANAIAAITLEDKSVDEAMQVYEGG